jgi:hypothetical protein
LDCKLFVNFFLKDIAVVGWYWYNKVYNIIPVPGNFVTGRGISGTGKKALVG